MSCTRDNKQFGSVHGELASVFPNRRSRTTPPLGCGRGGGGGCTRCRRARTTPPLGWVRGGGVSCTRGRRARTTPPLGWVGGGGSGAASLPSTLLIPNVGSGTHRPVRHERIQTVCHLACNSTASYSCWSYTCNQRKPSAAEAVNTKQMLTAMSVGRRGPGRTRTRTRAGQRSCDARPGPVLAGVQCRSHPPMVPQP